MQIEGLSALVKLEELTIRHNQILRQVLLTPYVCFCLPTIQVCWAFWLHKCAVCMLCVHVCQFCPVNICLDSSHLCKAEDVVEYAGQSMWPRLAILRRCDRNDWYLMSLNLLVTH